MGKNPDCWRHTLTVCQLRYKVMLALSLKCLSNLFSRMANLRVPNIPVSTIGAPFMRFWFENQHPCAIGLKITSVIEGEIRIMLHTEQSRANLFV